MDRALCPVLVGREREVSLLEDALLAAHRGGGQVVVIGGEAGVGKPRLAMELQERGRRAGTAVMVGTTSEADVALPYLPFIEAIGNYLAGADLDRIKLQLGPATDRQLGQLLPQFELQTTLIDPGEPAQAKMRLYEAILAFLRLAAERTGLLLVLEDLHWADPSTRELLEYIARRVRRRSRILLLATYRNDELNRRHPLRPLIQGWQRSGIAQIVDLQPLPPGGVARMVSAIFDNAPVEADLRDFLHERTEGNPFVLEELLKAALDQGDIFLTAGGWDRKAIHQLRLPPTVKQAILLRVERMTDEQADILRAAAVLGRSFDYRMLVGVSQQPEAAVLNALRAFVQDQLMDEEVSGRYRFRHALTREAIHDDLIAPERERLHACAADWLRSQLFPDKHDLAYHLMAAGHWDEAVPVAIEAARAAEADKAYADTAMLYERIVEHVPDPCERARVLSELGKAHFFSGETRRGQRYLEALGKVEEGLQWLDRSYLEAAERGFDWIASVALYNSIVDNLHHCRVREAKERMEHYEARFDPRGSRDAGFLQLQAFLAMRADGEPDRARPLLEAALPQAEETGETLFPARTHLELAYVYSARDRIPEGQRL